ncbi:MAG: histidine kinase [Bacteroidota bacterium]
MFRYPPTFGDMNFSCFTKVEKNKIAFGTLDGQAGIFDHQTNEIKFFKLISNSKVSSIAYNAERKALYISQEKSSLIIDLAFGDVIRSRSFNTAKELIPVDSEGLYFISYYGLVFIKDAFSDVKLDDRVYIDLNRAYASYRSPHSGDLFVTYVDELIRYDSMLVPHPIRIGERSVFAISITETTDQTVWVATLKNGIYGIRNGEIVSNIQVDDGLASQNITKIKSDGLHLWIISDVAVQQYDTKSLEIKTLSNQDGIPSYRVSGIEVIDNLVFFGTDEGVFSVDKNLVFKDRNPPDLTISAVSIMERDTVVAPFYKVAYDQNRFKFEFNSTTFQSLENISFNYRMLGDNEDWLSLQPGSYTINFGSLASGKYTLEVRAVNNANKKVSKTKSIEIVVLKPFWRQWWFIATVCLLIVGLTMLLFKRQQHIAIEKKELALREALAANKINSLKLENLRSQMNPHFIFNALNSIQEYIILNKKEEATDYLGKFSDLIRGYLTNSVEEMIPVRDELEGLQIYLELEKMRFEEDLSYRISFSDLLIKENYEIPTMLIQPYVENAIKHGLLHKKGPKILSVKATLEDSEEELLMKVIIEDNGIGREKAASLSLKHRPNHKSFGSQATADRLDLLNKNKNKQVGITYKDLHDDDRKPRGTRVVLLVPIA